MWISILNYNIGQIEVADVTEDFAENETATDNNEKVVDWLESNGFCSDEVGYMLTDECPLCVVNNVETHLTYKIMEKTINEVKKNAKTLENDILKLISDFEVANPEVEVRVTVGRNYSTVEDGKITHRADVDLTIK